MEVKYVQICTRMYAACRDESTFIRTSQKENELLEIQVLNIEP